MTAADILLEEALSKSSIHQLRRWVCQYHLTDRVSNVPLKIFVLRNHMLDNIADFLRAWGHKAGLNVTVEFSDYNQLEQEVYGADSRLNQSGADITLLSLVYDSNLTISRLDHLLSGLTSTGKSMIFCNMFLKQVYGHDIDEVTNLNKAYENLTRKYPAVFLIDWNRIEQQIGIDRSRDYRFWYTSKILLTPSFLNIYAREIIDQAKGIKGKIKKCLVLDCDGTLWGGVIGEDGVQGIQLDPDVYPGNIYYDFQRRILSLYEQGVLLALCSKNNEKDVLEVIDGHPHCLIRRTHLTAMRINWEDKATNITALAQELNLGLDSFVFLDDSLTECAWIKEQLKDVAVLDVPKDLFTYPQIIDKSGFFLKRGLTAEDKKRSLMLQEEFLRKEAAVHFYNQDDFLKSLNLTAKVWKATEQEIERATQLTQKTNQFNLTTRRYTVSTMGAMIHDPNKSVLCLSLKDKFGDYGLVGLAIITYRDQQAYLDSFLMSCRVLGKKVEQVLLMACKEKVKTRHITQINGEYLETPKNHQTKYFLKDNGFNISKEEPSRIEFTCDLTRFYLTWPECYFEIVVN